MTKTDATPQVTPLLAGARARAGLDDFVDEGFIEPLSHLLAAYRSETGTSAQGFEGIRMEPTKESFDLASGLLYSSLV